MMMNDYTIVKSWLGCADIESVRLIGRTLHIKYVNGSFQLEDVEETSVDNIQSIQDQSTYDSMISCPGHTTCPGQK